jgi:hypothetical protein
MDAFTIICSILLLYILIFLYKKYHVTKSKLVTSGTLLYGDSRTDGYYPPNVPSWHKDTLSFQYWNSDPGIQNWILASPQLVYTKAVNVSDPAFDWVFNSDGLFYVTYNYSFGLVHVSKNSSNDAPTMTVISSYNGKNDKTHGLNFYSDGPGPHLNVQSVNNESGVLMVFKMFDGYLGSGPVTNRPPV